jgi:FixJ family two-component response regulator
MDDDNLVATLELSRNGPDPMRRSLESTPQGGTRVSRPLLIAVVDDDESFRPALVESLSSLGYGVRDFPSAEDLVASGSETLYDCIITDIHLAGMSGIDLKSQLTRRGVNVPVIMITGRSDPSLEIKAAAGGAVGLLRKPFESSTLVAHLERALGAR